MLSQRYSFCKKSVANEICNAQVKYKKLVMILRYLIFNGMECLVRNLFIYLTKDEPNRSNKIIFCLTY